MDVYFVSSGEVELILTDGDEEIARLDSVGQKAMYILKQVLYIY
jgi:hypothetical protein